jgi:hypothetical protein
MRPGEHYDSRVGLSWLFHSGFAQSRDLARADPGMPIAASGAMRRYLSTLAVAASVCATGCGGVDTDIEDQITIDQGVYGLLIAGCDSANCRAQPAANQDVVVFVPGADDVSATSDGGGVYQVALPPGDYTICTDACTPLTIPTGTIRYDWTSGPGGGNWEPQD